MQNGPVYEGKCGFKQLQYMAVGVPFVSSWVGGARDFVHHGENGLVADTGRGLVWHLKALVKPQELRRRLAQNGRNRLRSIHGCGLAAIVHFVTAATLERVDSVDATIRYDRDPLAALAQHVIPRAHPQDCPAVRIAELPRRSTLANRPLLGGCLLHRSVRIDSTERPQECSMRRSEGGQNPTTWKGGNGGDKLDAVSRARGDGRRRFLLASKGCTR